ncbi:ROK family protein [Mesorhizobium sp. BAC0120]|uniref:ROK family protein n=1 Tax=Mesorhizobium sp. BAC0120 TaxID=3090670 RepID=UPI00298CDB7B|nr:ROK family protein [Mesorhizobium sp. BAC0120]MDW6024360.1 ROK family protein [Mesorhizobium sp. BAC0120]
MRHEMAGAAAIGVDIGGTHIRAARISSSGDVSAWEARPTPATPLVIDCIVELARALDEPSVSAIGIGIPGRVDARSGLVLSGGYVDLSTYPLAQAIGERTGRPAFLDNDGNAALTAEHAVGAARGADTVVMFTIGTGIGGAVIADGKLLRGRAAAGQMGHITVDSGGRACLCGRHGCVETTSSGTALRRHMAEAGFAGSSVETLLSRLTDGDAAACSVLAAWAAPMRIAIDTAVAIFDPDLVVLGGGLGAAMHQALAAFPAETPWYRCEVVPASLGDRAGVIGAGLTALNGVAEVKPT